jgi:hypothetical protein
MTTSEKRIAGNIILDAPETTARFYPITTNLENPPVD